MRRQAVVLRAGDMKPGDVFHTLLTKLPGAISEVDSWWWKRVGGPYGVGPGIPVILTLDEGKHVARVIHPHVLLRRDAID